MNKQNLSFISLFSIILILCVYYLTVPANIMEDIEPNIDSNDVLVNAEEISSLVALKVENDEQVMNEINDLEEKIVDDKTTIEEKNIAYEELKNVNFNRGKEEELINIIKEEFEYDNYIKIENDNVNIVINSKEHNKELANNIIKRIQKEFTSKKYITVKFQ